MNSDLRQPDTQPDYEQSQLGGREAEGKPERAARAPEGRQEGQEDEEEDGGGEEKEKTDEEQEEAGETKENDGPGELDARGWVTTAGGRCRRCP